METENIIAVNIPNTVSILIMVMLGGVIVWAIRKGLMMQASGG